MRPGDWKKKDDRCRFATKKTNQRETQGDQGLSLQETTDGLGFGAWDSFTVQGSCRPVRGVGSYHVHGCSTDDHGAVPVRHVACDDDLDAPLGQPTLSFGVDWGRISILAEVGAVDDSLALVPVARPAGERRRGFEYAYTIREGEREKDGEGEGGRERGR